MRFSWKLLIKFRFFWGCFFLYCDFLSFSKIRFWSKLKFSKLYLQTLKFLETHLQKSISLAMARHCPGGLPTLLTAGRCLPYKLASIRPGFGPKTQSAPPPPPGWLLQFQWNNTGAASNDLYLLLRLQNAKCATTTTKKISPLLDPNWIKGKLGSATRVKQREREGKLNKLMGLNVSDRWLEIIKVGQ